MKKLTLRRKFVARTPTPGERLAALIAEIGGVEPTPPPPDTVWVVRMFRDIRVGAQFVRATGDPLCFKMNDTHYVIVGETISNGRSIQHDTPVFLDQTAEDRHQRIEATALVVAEGVLRIAPEHRRGRTTTQALDEDWRHTMPAERLRIGDRFKLGMGDADVTYLCNNEPEALGQVQGIERLLNDTIGRVVYVGLTQQVHVTTRMWQERLSTGWRGPASGGPG